MKPLIFSLFSLLVYVFGLYIGWDDGVKSDAESCAKTGFFYYHNQVFRCEKK